MSKPIDDGGPAFPRPLGFYPVVGGTFNEAQRGMSLRDFFAAHIAQGWLAMCADPDIQSAVIPDDLAATCYEYADAMIAERNKTK